MSRGWLTPNRSPSGSKARMRTTIRKRRIARSCRCRRIRAICGIRKRKIFSRDIQSQLSQSLRLPLLHQVDSPRTHREVDEEAITLQFLRRLFEQSYQGRGDAFWRAIHTSRSIETDYHRTLARGMGKTKLARRLRHLTLIAESLEPSRTILIYKESLHILVTILGKFERKQGVEVIAHGDTLYVASSRMLHLHIHTRSNGKTVLAIGICHTSHLRHNLLDFGIAVLHLHLVQSAFELRLRPAVRHQLPSLYGSLLRDTFHLDVASHLVHHTD